MALFRNLPVLAILLMAECVSAQQKKPPTARPPRAKLNALDKLSRMPPKQREQQLEKLSPERRAQLEDKLEKYNRLPQAQKDRLRAQTEVFQNLPARKAGGCAKDVPALQ